MLLAAAAPIVAAGSSGAPAARATRLQPRSMPAPPAGPQDRSEAASALAGSNDTCASAQALTLNVPVAGTLAGAANDYELAAGCFSGPGNTPSTAQGRDVVYTFTAPASGSYSFRVRDYQPADQTNLVLYVASSCPAATPGTPVVVSTCLAAANRGGASTSEAVSCIALAMNQQVAIYVDENVLQVPAATFTVEATTCSQESEANDTTATADPIACGVEGTITPAGDVDFYSIGTPPAGSRVFAMIDAIQANTDDFDLRVTTATDTLEYDEGNNDTPFGSNAPNVAGVPLTGAPTFLRVNFNNSLVAAGPYRLYSVVQPPIAQATAEVEPNDTIANGTTAANNYFVGSLSTPEPSADVDIYCFTANAGDLIFVGLDADPERNNSPINAALALLDASGAVLVSVNDPSQGTVTTPSPGTLTGISPDAPGEALVYRATASGTYYARVSIGTTSTASIGAGNYLLSISKNCAAGGGVAQSADLSITKSANPSPAVTLQELTYTVTVTNPGPSTATSVAVSDTLPAGTTFTSCSVSGGTGGTCSGPPVGSSGTVTASWTTLLPGQSAQLVIVTSVTAAMGATLTNTATVTSPTPDPNTANNTTTIMTPVSGPQADLTVAKFDSPDPVTAGQNLTYSVFVANDGPSPAQSITLTDPLPGNVTFVSATEPVGWDCTVPAPGTTGTITCTTASLASGANETLTFVVNVNASVPNGSLISNTATVSSATSDPDTTNNQSTAMTEVLSGVSAGTDTVGVYVPSSGAWFLRNSNTQGAADLTFFYGAAGSGFVELSGDWDGDGDDTPGLYDPSTGFFFLRNSNTSGPADLTFQFGVGGAGILPITGDWDGDGDDTVGIYNTTNGTFFLRNTNASGPADVTFVFGVGGATIRPVTGDFDGDGDDTIGIYNTANGTFFLKNTNSSGPADLTFNFGVGGATIVPLFGDYDGDGDDTVGLYNSANGSFFLKNTNAGGAADLTFFYGPAGARPLVGDWNGQ